MFVSRVKGPSGVMLQIRAYRRIEGVMFERHCTSRGPPTSSEYALPSTFFNDARAHPVVPGRISFALADGNTAMSVDAPHRSRTFSGMTTCGERCSGLQKPDLSLVRRWFGEWAVGHVR